ncbi:MAG: UDP-N-acetylmuramoylalanine--D-glutamate ligase [Syntrophaceae bacterium PtaU1.Bin231]|nr:MAG: UDP-N-acetylmuramoylalanine--D-glutamate ligase [Syntrophaceae bacterium PtaU1.Bin231]
MDVTGKKVLVVGLGKTGIAAVRLLACRGARIVAVDEKPFDCLSEAQSRLRDVEWSLGTYGPESLEGVSLVVPSPGVPPADRILREAVSRGVSVLSEMEIAFRLLKPPAVAITGTNGKTTVTTLIGNILKKAGKKVFVGGNIGAPLAGYVVGPQGDDYAVIEVSSFQLQWIERFHPRIAVHLNTTCDHVDYHGSFEEYRRVKDRIFANQEADDLAILNADEPWPEERLRPIRATIRRFSSSRIVTDGMYLDAKDMILAVPGAPEERYPRSLVRIPGVHNLENVMAAILACRACGCPPEAAARAVEEFPGISHRIEHTATKNGVAFYDDSKGTNVDAVRRALQTFDKPIILLLGGRDKEGDFETLASLVRERVKRLVLFGEARDRIEERLGGIVPTEKIPSLGPAIEAAYSRAAAGDIVLLSPGCASFDEFANYKERGNFFKEVVRRL